MKTENNTETKKEAEQEAEEKIQRRKERRMTLESASKELARAIKEFDQEHDSSYWLNSSYWLVRYWLMRVGEERYQKVFADCVESAHSVSGTSEDLQAIMGDATEETELYGKYE
jgi:hypothetical protein